MLANRYLFPLAGIIFCACFFPTNEVRAIQPVSPAGSIVGQLKSARALLSQADHDYQGHRAKAVHEISKAIHALQGSGVKSPLTPQQKAAVLAARQAKAAAKQAGAAAKPMREPQALSDGQLRTALNTLVQVSVQLGTAKPNVRAHVDVAIGELKTALAIK